MATGSGKTGKPSISDIRNLDVRSISMAVSNIRQRIEAIEGALGVTTDTAQAAATTSGLQLKELLNEISALDSRVTILEKAASTDIVAYTAGETIASGQGVVGISASTIGVADPSDPTRMFGLIGIATNGGSVGASILVQRRGVFAVPGASAFFVGRAAYLDNAGFVTQTPDYEATSLPIGVAVSGSQIFVDPGYPAVLNQAFSSGFADAFEQYIPITRSGAPTGQTLEQLIDGVSYSSGIPALGQVPFTTGGVALRANAGDFWRFIFDSPYSSGVDSHALVPVEIGGAVVLVNAGDIAALGGGGLTPIPDGDVLGNISGLTAVPVAVGLSALIDHGLGSTRGAILTRQAAAWAILAPGTLNYLLASGGAGADVAYVAPPTGLTAIADGSGLVNVSGGSALPVATTLSAWIDHVLGSTRGAIITRQASGWALLAPGTSGYFLASGGAGADPSYAAVTGLSAIADGDLLANISGGSAVPIANTLTALIDHAIGSTRGSILTRQAAGWALLTPGTSGYVLTSAGAGADPAYAAIPPEVDNVSWRTVSGDTTLSPATDNQNGLYCTKSSGTQNITIPGDTGVPANDFPVGASVLVYASGAAAVDIAPVSGTNLFVRSGLTTNLKGQYSVATLLKTATNEWFISGDLGP